MSNNNYILQIYNPCPQDWNAMIQNENGRFCDQCSKTVIDFSKLTDAEVIALIEKSSGNMCGNLASSQLNRKFSKIQPSKSLSFYKFLTGLFLIGSVKNATAQTLNQFKLEILPQKHGSDRIIPTEANKDTKDSVKNHLIGIVKDAETQEPLPFVNIQIKDTKIGIATDFEGNFKLEIPDDLLTQEIVLVISSVGFTSKMEVIAVANLSQCHEIFIKELGPRTYRGEVCIRSYRKKRWWRFW